MRAVILEAKGRKAVVLTSEGSFAVIRNRGYAVGQTLVLPKKPSGVWTKRVLSAAACLCLLCGSGVLAACKWLPYSYVSLDVNPSVAYTLNFWDEVLTVSAVNEDAEEVLKTMEVIAYEPVTDAVARTLSVLEDSGYYMREEGCVLLAVASGGAEERLTKDLQRVAQDATADTAQAAVIGISQDEVEQARALGVSGGRLHMAQQEFNNADKSPSEAEMMAWAQKPVRELIEGLQTGDSRITVPEVSLTNQVPPEADAAHNLPEEAVDAAAGETKEALSREYVQNETDRQSAESNSVEESSATGIVSDSKLTDTVHTPSGEKVVPSNQDKQGGNVPNDTPFAPASKQAAFPEGAAASEENQQGAEGTAKQAEDNYPGTRQGSQQNEAPSPEQKQPDGGR